VVIPAELGIRLKLFSRMDFSFFGVYNLAMSDYIDNIKSNGNDSYLFAGFSLTIHLAKQNEETEPTRDKHLSPYEKAVAGAGRSKQKIQAAGSSTPPSKGSMNQTLNKSEMEKADAKHAQKQATGNTTAKTIPDEFKSADLNHDGYISTSEVTAAIDGFFDGSNDFTVEKLHRLVDFFFEQE
jgi:hypothetical protein